MARLFDNSDNISKIEPGQLTRNGEPVDMFSLYEADSSIGLVTESFKTIPYHYDMVRHIEQAYNSKNHLLAVESYNPLLKSLASNLGLKTFIPSLEDYKNEYSAKSSKEVALEGLNDFIKKVWEGIKKFFHEFFKKISEFARRLVNANLQIDTYERYVPDLLKKIHSDRLVCLDPKKEVNSKLAELLAPEGLDSIDDAWVVNNLKTVCGYTIDMMNSLIEDRLPSFVKEDLNNLSEVFGRDYQQLKDIRSLDELDIALENIDAKIINYINTIVRKICPNVVEANDLPEEAYDRIADLSVDTNVSDLTINAFTSVKSILDRLPGNFNLFIGTDNGNKLYSVTFKETDDKKSKTIKVLSSARYLDSVYDQYKDLTKGLNISKMIKVFDTVEDVTSKFIKVVPNDIEKLRKTYSSKKSPVLKDMSEKDMETIGDQYNFIANFIARGRISKVIYDSQLSYNIEMSQVLEIVDQLPELREIVKLDGTKNSYGAYEIIEEIINNNMSGLGESEAFITPVIKSLNENEKRVINFIQNLQIALRGVQSTYPGLVTDLRYEVLKYVYDSARNFG